MRPAVSLPTEDLLSFLRSTLDRSLACQNEIQLVAVLHLLANSVNKRAQGRRPLLVSPQTETMLIHSVDRRARVPRAGPPRLLRVACGVDFLARNDAPHSPACLDLGAPSSPDPLRRGF